MAAPILLDGTGRAACDLLPPPALPFAVGLQWTGRAGADDSADDCQRRLSRPTTDPVSLDSVSSSASYCCCEKRKLIDFCTAAAAAGVAIAVTPFRQLLSTLDDRICLPCAQHCDAIPSFRFEKEKNPARVNLAQWLTIPSWRHPCPSDPAAD